MRALFNSLGETMMTWEQLAERITSMAPHQRQEPTQPVADRFVLAALFLKVGEEPLTDFRTATGIRYVLDEIEDLEGSDRMAWYVRKS
jgi:hypothetical protein